MSSNVTYYPLDAPEYHPDEIPKLLGKGGVNIKNAVRHATKLWYESHSSEDDGSEKMNPPKITLQVRPTPEEDCTGGIQIAYSTPDVDQDMHLKMRPFVWEAISALVKRLHLGQTAALERQAKKVSKNSEKKHQKTANLNTMRQIFRVEMDPMMLGKIVGKGGRNIKNMIKYVTDNDLNKSSANNTKIFVKEQTTDMKKNSSHIDLTDYSDGSGKYILFIVTVETPNSYLTMRNAEKAICLSINRSYEFDENASNNEIASSMRERELTQKMIDESSDFPDSDGW